MIFRGMLRRDWGWPHAFASASYHQMGEIMNAFTFAIVAVLGCSAGIAVAGDTVKAPKPPKVSEVAKNAVLGAGNAVLTKPCAPGKTTDGTKGGAICNEVAGQIVSSLSNQTAPNAMNIGAIAKQSAAGVASTTLSKPCAAGTTTTAKAGSAMCNELAGQMAASLSNQTAPSAKNIGAIAKQAAVGAAGATLSKPCAAGTTASGKAGGAICNEVAGQLAASLASQTAPNAKNVAAVAKGAMVGVAAAGLSKPCVAGTTATGQAGSAVCKEVAGQLAASLGNQTALNTKNISAGVQAAASNAVAASAGQKISQMLTGSQQPIIGDLLALGLKSQLPGGDSTIGTFAPPNSALPMGTEGLRNGLSIISNDQGKAGLGMKSDVAVGSKKFEISGSLDPNSDSDQGKSAGMQIKIGGD